MMICKHQKTYYNELGEKCADCGVYVLKSSDPRFKAKLKQKRRKITRPEPSKKPR